MSDYRETFYNGYVSRYKGTTSQLSGDSLTPYFAMWKYNKKIPLRDSIWLFVLPVMGLYAIVRQMLNIPQTGFEGILFFVILGYILYSFFKKAKTQ